MPGKYYKVFGLRLWTEATLQPRWVQLLIGIRILSLQIDIRAKTASSIKNWANPGLFLFIFVFFTLHISMNWWKHRWCAWDLNPGWQDGRRRRIHWAMAAPHSINYNNQLIEKSGSFYRSQECPVFIVVLTLSGKISLKRWSSLVLVGANLASEVFFTRV